MYSSLNQEPLRNVHDSVPAHQIFLLQNTAGATKSVALTNSSPEHPWFKAMPGRWRWNLSPPPQLPSSSPGHATGWPSRSHFGGLCFHTAPSSCLPQAQHVTLCLDSREWFCLFGCLLLLPLLWTGRSAWVWKLRSDKLWLTDFWYALMPLPGRMTKRAWQNQSRVLLLHSFFCALPSSPRSLVFPSFLQLDLLVLRVSRMPGQFSTTEKQKHSWLECGAGPLSSHYS